MKNMVQELKEVLGGLKPSECDRNVVKGGTVPAKKQPFEEFMLTRLGAL